MTLSLPTKTQRITEPLAIAPRLSYDLFTPNAAPSVRLSHGPDRRFAAGDREKACNPAMGRYS